MRGSWGIDPGWGITIVRVVMAVILIPSGYAKFAGGLAGPIAFFSKAGIPAPEFAAPFIAGLELVGGLLLLVGVAGRWLGVLFFLEFVVAGFYVNFPARGFAGARLELMLMAAGALVALAGPGRAAVDRVWLEKRG